MEYFTHHGSGLHRLIYTSRSTRPLSGGEIAIVTARWGQTNRAIAVTGLLLSYDGWYAQVLEGSYSMLKPLFDSIAADPRHTDVKLRMVEPAPLRMFSRWGMKLGRGPTDAVGFDIGAATPAALLHLLKLAALSPVRRAA